MLWVLTWTSWDLLGTCVGGVGGVDGGGIGGGGTDCATGGGGTGCATGGGGGGGADNDEGGWSKKQHFILISSWLSCHIDIAFNFYILHYTEGNHSYK